MIRKLFENWRGFLKEELCSPKSHSEGWVKPDGNYIEVSEQPTRHHRSRFHAEFAEWYFDENIGLASLREKIDFEKSDIGQVHVSYFTKKLKWVRVSNAWSYEGPHPKILSSEQLSKIREIVTSCQLKPKFKFVYEWFYMGKYEDITEPDPKRFLLALKQGGKIAPSKVAQFREDKGKQK